MSSLRTISRLIAGLRTLARFKECFVWGTEDHVCAQNSPRILEQDAEHLETLGWEFREGTQDGDIWVFCTDMPPEEDYEIMGDSRITSGVDGRSERI